MPDNPQQEGAFDAAAFADEHYFQAPENGVVDAVRAAYAAGQAASGAQQAASEMEITLLRSRLRTIHLAGTHGMSNREVADRVAELENISDQSRQYIQNAQQREHRIHELEDALAAPATARLSVTAAQMKVFLYGRFTPHEHDWEAVAKQFNALLRQPAEAERDKFIGATSPAKED